MIRLVNVHQITEGTRAPKTRAFIEIEVSEDEKGLLEHAFTLGRPDLKYDLALTPKKS